MNEFSPDRAAVLAKAARLVESAGFAVLDRDCKAGGGRLDLVAATSSGTLAVIEVTAAEPDAVRGSTASITPGRLRELIDAGAAWLHAHDGYYTEFRVCSLVLTPDTPGEAVPQQAGEAR